MWMGEEGEREKLKSCFGSDCIKLLGVVILMSEAVVLFHFFSQEDQLCFVLCQAFFFIQFTLSSPKFSGQ